MGRWKAVDYEAVDKFLKDGKLTAVEIAQRVGCHATTIRDYKREVIRGIKPASKEKLKPAAYVNPPVSQTETMYVISNRYMQEVMKLVEKKPWLRQFGITH